MYKLIAMTILFIGSISIVNAKSFKKIEAGCNAGNAKACYDAGNIYSAEAYKKKGYKEDEAAFKIALFYKKSCNLGYAEGCTAYAMSYAADKEKNSEKDARYFFQKGCDGGDKTGCTMLKMMPLGK